MQLILQSDLHMLFSSSLCISWLVRLIVRRIRGFFCCCTFSFLFQQVLTPLNSSWSLFIILFILQQAVAVTAGRRPKTWRVEVTVHSKLTRELHVSGCSVSLMVRRWECWLHLILFGGKLDKVSQRFQLMFLVFSPLPVEDHELLLDHFKALL